MKHGVVILGGGPAGCAAAICLARAGHAPSLIERFACPTDKVCGDFLAEDAIARLRALGVDPARLGAAPINCLRLIHKRGMAQAALPFAASGLSRRALDAALLHRARDAGASIHLGQPARRIGWVAGAARVEVGHGAPIEASAVFLATGKHDLRDLPRPGVANGSVGMKMYYALSPRQTQGLGRAIELILFPGGYAGLQPVEAGKATLCIAISRKRFQAVGGTWSSLLEMIVAASPHLDDRLRGAAPLLQRPLAVAGVPYGLLHAPNAVPNPALFRLGDQAAVIPSLTGDGIAIALQSGRLAAETWHAGLDAPTYHRRLAHDLGGQMRLARLLHRAALSGPLQALAIRTAAWFPGLLRQAARGTRVGGPMPKPAGGTGRLAAKQRAAASPSARP